ncbi:MAG TPA: (5-formylfuran-3-yl)methyl phosphate synthase [Methylophilus sp.]|nr:(5-formylfuran-3-yl)methyl phosphate synthase [Methylophilus sp.]HQQ33405.1 (5-formylfuran-3-yl)methyl phosphate synthase [Methylophilus sp.]
MKKLLVSVKNSEEASLALESGADIIDLKDPSVGALGALGLMETEDVMRVLNNRALVSATVGEGYLALKPVMDAICHRIALGVDIVKIVASEVFYHDDSIEEFYGKISKEIKLIGVFFADTKMDFDLLPKLRRLGFYGAMLDTQSKKNGLLQICSLDELDRFVNECNTNKLISGLAGSLQTQDIDILDSINATYLGFRGGLCENATRTYKLSQTKIELAKKLLLKRNKIGSSSQTGANIQLHEA